MDINKHRENAFGRLLANKPELDYPSSHFFEKSNQPRETRMSNLRLKPSEVWKQPGRLPADGRLSSSENRSKSRRRLFFVACLALFACVPLVWHPETSILILIMG
jgi:hypothetical protein